MKGVIARQNIHGVTTDAGLLALDGIVIFSAETNDVNELVAIFEREHPECISWRYEIVSGNE